jgi:hypothetical protein
MPGRMRGMPNARKAEYANLTRITPTWYAGAGIGLGRGNRPPGSSKFMYSPGFQCSSKPLKSSDIAGFTAVLCPKLSSLGIKFSGL